MKDISPKVSNVIMHENHTLTITFETGEVKTFDIKPYLRY
ncbi:DUF2442 domain-containing protein [Clostridium estertheticum]|nr:DUF2442 domain-containing protein [Clostridium estertheticum]MBU3176665.1 DUF2442 domain-containing protein [Clostridium estertheticum]